MRRSFLVAATLALAACPEPGQYEGPIPFNATAKQLLLVPGRARDAGAPAAAPAHAARVHAMKPGEELSGPEATGAAGDFVLENDEVTFVVQALGPGLGVAESGGNLVDAADAHQRRDELGLMMTSFGGPSHQAIYETLGTGVDASGTAWIEARGHELHEDGVAVATRYALAPPDRALLVTTTVNNVADHAVSLPFGDAIAWGRAERVAPGKPAGFEGATSGSYVGGVGRFTSYALSASDGDLDATSEGAWTTTTQKSAVALAPGASESYARVLMVGARGDLASVLAELAHASGGEVGALALAVVDDAGSPVLVPFGAKVALATRSGADVMSLRPSASGGEYGGEVLPGDYLARWVEGGGRAARGAPVAVRVKANDVARAKLVVGPPGELQAECDEGGKPAPCRITIEGLAGAADPDLGPGYLAGPARNGVASETGKVDLPLVPGRYRVTMSRGPAYARVATEVDVPAGGKASVTGALARVVDTSGYVALDLPGPTVLSGEGPASVRDRLVAAAAEGVDVVVETEIDAIVDPSPSLGALGLAPFVDAVAGEELSSDTSARGWGRVFAFPMLADPSRPRGGAIPVRDRAEDALLTALADPGRAFAGGQGARPADHLDALAIWTGAAGPALDDYLARLRAGGAVTPIAAEGNEPCFARTYVRVAPGAAARPSARDVAAGLRSLRDVVLTNGPFLRVTANDGPMGSLVTARDVVLKIHLACAPWACPDHVEVLSAGARPAAEVRLTPAALPSGGRVADGTYRVRLAADDALLVVARGGASLTPYAMTGPVWIDADGDGHALGR